MACGPDAQQLEVDASFGLPAAPGPFSLGLLLNTGNGSRTLIGVNGSVMLQHGGSHIVTMVSQLLEGCLLCSAEQCIRQRQAGVPAKEYSHVTSRVQQAHICTARCAWMETVDSGAKGTAAPAIQHSQKVRG